MIDGKTMKTFVGIFLIICIVYSAHSVDYCKIKCTGNAKHVGCNATNKLAPACKAGQIYEFNNNEIQYILHLHNDYRNAICNGSISGFAPCKQMAKMVWNRELAKLAGYNSRTCYGAHDRCRNTEKFKRAGQNIEVIASWSNSRTYPVTEEVIRVSIYEWFKEYKYADMSDIYSYKGGEKNGHLIGHFAQLLLANATEVGCGGTRYFQKNINGLGQGRFYMTCDYSTGLVSTFPIYIPGESGSSCRTGTDPIYNALCTEYEQLNPNYYGWANQKLPRENQVNSNDDFNIVVS